MVLILSFPSIGRLSARISVTMSRGNLLLLVRNRAFVFPAGGFVGLHSAFGIFKNRLGSRQPLFDDSYPFGQGRNFFLQAQDFPIRLLQCDQVLNVWKHLQK